QAEELAVVVRSAEPAPVAQHVHVDTLAEKRPFANRRQTRVRPTRYGERSERGAEARMVRRRRLRADTGAGATLHLAREAGADAPLQSERFPAQRMLGRELA